MRKDVKFRVGPDWGSDPARLARRLRDLLQGHDDFEPVVDSEGAWQVTTDGHWELVVLDQAEGIVQLIARPPLPAYHVKAFKTVLRRLFTDPHGQLH